MQCGGEQHPETSSVERRQIWLAAHAAGAVELRPRGAGGKRCREAKIRPSSGAHPVQVQRDQPGGPELRMLEQLGRAQQALLPEVEGEEKGVGLARQGLQQAQVRQGFAAHHRGEPTGDQAAPIGEVAHARVHPQLHRCELPRQGLEQGPMTPPSQDGVQVCDVEGAKWVEGEQCLGHVLGVAAGA